MGLVGRWDDVRGHSSRAVARVPAHGQDWHASATRPAPRTVVAGRMRGLQWTHGRPGARARLGTPAPGARRPAPRAASIGAPRRRPGAAQGGVAAGGPAPPAGRCDRSRAGGRRGRGQPGRRRRRGPALARLSAAVREPRAQSRTLQGCTDADGPRPGGRYACAGSGHLPAIRRDQPGDPMSDPIEPVEISTLDRTLLEELEPEVGRLVERHLKVAQEWFPHEYIPYAPRPGLRQGALDARPAAADRRRPDGVRDRPPDRGQPAQLPPPDPRHVRQGRRGLDALGRPLDGRGGPARDRAARLPHGHPQPRPGGARARTDEPAPAGLRPRLAGHAPRARVRRVPGARDPDLPSQHGPLLGRPGRRPDHGPDRRRREPAHGLLPRRPERRAQDRPVGRRSARSSTRSSSSRCRAPGSRASCARRRTSRRPASTTCACTATRSCCRSCGTGGSSS